MAIGETIQRDIKTSLRRLARRLEILEGTIASPSFGGRSLRNIGVSDEAITPNRAFRKDEAEGSSILQVLTNCTASETVGDAVYIHNNGQIRRASATSITTSKVIGFITSKPTSTTCYVALAGVATGFTGLSVNKQYFLSENPGEITISPPTTAGSVLTQVGRPLTTTQLVIGLSNIYTIRS